MLTIIFDFHFTGPFRPVVDRRHQPGIYSNVYIMLFLNANVLDKYRNFN